MSFRLDAIYLVPLGSRMPAGIDGGVCLKPLSRSAGPRHRTQWTGVPALFGGPNGTTKQGMAFAAFEPRGDSG